MTHRLISFKGRFGGAAEERARAGLQTPFKKVVRGLWERVESPGNRRL